jgi:hypothetical protein
MPRVPATALPRRPMPTGVVVAILTLPSRAKARA